LWARPTKKPQQAQKKNVSLGGDPPAGKRKGKGDGEVGVGQEAPV